MKILVVCRKFNGVVGGVEKMSTSLMNEMAQRGHTVSLFTWDDNEDAKSFFPIDASIQWHKMAMGAPAQKAGMALRLKRALKIRKILKAVKPDVIVGFQEGSYTSFKLYGLGLGIPVMCAVRESPFRYRHIKSYPPFWLTCQLLRLCPAITVQFERYKMAFPGFLRSRVHTIPNHIETQAQAADITGRDGLTKTILSTGRLSPEKNHAALIDAFGAIAQRHPDWRLVIIGKGGLHDALRAQADTFPKDVSERIHIEGPSNDILGRLQESHIYCQSSKWEGFPNSVLEAMACGVPSVGYRESDGVSDLIEDGITGLLADGNGDAGTLARALDILMSDSTLRARLGKAAYDQSLQYAPQKVFDMWQSLMEKVAS